MASTLPSEKRAEPRSRIGEFFYASEVPYGLALVRILMPLVLIMPMLVRLPHVREMFSADGSPIPLWESFGNNRFLPELPGTVVVALYAAMMFFFVTASIGWRSRLSLIASCVLYTYFTMIDSIGTVTKYTVIASHILFLLSLSQCGAVWSVDAWLQGLRRNRWPGEPAVDWPRSAAWPRRLMQLLVGTVYFGAAITKMHTPAYFSGDQLITWMLTNVNFQNPLGEFLTLYPALMVVFAYITIVWEVLFLFLAWSGWWRRIFLAVGVMFHVMTTFLLGLYVFPMVCITTYFAFVNEDDVWYFAALRRRVRRKLFGAARSAASTPGRRLALPDWLRLPSPVVFGLATLAVVSVGVQAEHLQDPYGLRRPEGPYQLRELDREYVAKLLGPSEPLREVDKFYALDLGTTLLGGFLADRRREFKQNETLVAQISLNPPHEDMWVECNLHDARGRIIDRVGQVVMRETFRAFVNYRLTEAIAPGEYFVMVKSGGREISRRKFTLLPDAGAARPVAN